MMRVLGLEILPPGNVYVSQQTQSLYIYHDFLYAQK